MDEQPRTSKDQSNKNDPDEESRCDQTTNNETQLSNYSSKSRLEVAAIGVEKTKPPSKPKGKFEEKKLTKRRTGRVEKQRKQPTRRHMTKRTSRRKTRARSEKKRVNSVSTIYSRLSSSGLETPACKRCGHRFYRRM
ncbi:unnamed protein product [Pieris macdunnoughi]|uniref:Uncharacterized protein n=1 Tax=Pieris macdunnoughi TaxID=345717 RepID=A0A821QSM7_9NEOP|nr:unnamed protein product [Pieris macdunnoughi]